MHLLLSIKFSTDPAGGSVGASDCRTQQPFSPVGRPHRACRAAGAGRLPRSRHIASHHAALPYALVPAFLEILRASAAGDVPKIAFEFLILTATRTSEVVGARWEEIDQAAKMWTIPATRIKAGREHRIPLSRRCLELLDRAEILADGGPYVFPGRSAQKPLSNMVFLMMLRRLKADDITATAFGVRSVIGRRKELTSRGPSARPH